MGYFNKVQQLINKTSRHALVLVCMLACGISCNADTGKKSKDAALKDDAINGLQIISFQKALDDTFSSVMQSRSDISDISDDTLSAYEEFCVSNNYLGRPAQKNVLIYEKTATDFSTYLRADRPRMKACMLAGLAVSSYWEKDSSAINQYSHSGRYKDAKNIVEKRMKELSSMAGVKLKFNSEDEDNRYAIFKDSLLSTQKKLQLVLNELEKLESDDNREAAANVNQIHHIDYSTGKIHCKNGHATDVFDDCKSDGNHFICDSMADRICNQK